MVVAVAAMHNSCHAKIRFEIASTLASVLGLPRHGFLLVREGGRVDFRGSLYGGPDLF